MRSAILPSALALFLFAAVAGCSHGSAARQSSGSTGVPSISPMSAGETSVGSAPSSSSVAVSDSEACRIFTTDLAASAMPTGPSVRQFAAAGIPACQYQSTVDTQINMSFLIDSQPEDFCSEGIGFQPMSGVGTKACYLESSPQGAGRTGMLHWMSHTGSSYGISMSTDRPQDQVRAILIALAKVLDQRVS